MDFVSFLLVNAALFIRPGEIAPPLAGVPIYQILILLCLACSAPKFIAQWTSQSLSERPVTLCMLGLLVSVIMSHLAHFDVSMARYWGMDFARVVLYYLIFVAVVDTPARLRGLLIWLLIFIAAMTALSLCQYFGYVDIPTLKVLERHEGESETGEAIIILQLVGTGIFNDPNDYALILAFGCMISLYLSNDRRFGLFRPLWLGFFGLFAYALILTQSRGGLLALAAGLLVFLATIIGTRRACIAALIAIPLALPMIGGRMANLSTGADTAQERMRLWQEALAQFRRSPLFGIGMNTLADELGLVAHNSYVHCYAEMGFLGGTCFVGTFFFAAMILLRLGRRGRPILDPETRRMRPYLMAILAMFVVGFYSLTRCYVASTYVPVALVEAYQQFAVTVPPDSNLRTTPRLVAGLGLVSLGCLIGISLFVRVFVQ